MYAVLNRIREYGDRTLGVLSLYSEESFLIGECFTLELPWRDNQKMISRIPRGDYYCKPKKSNKYGHCWYLNGDTVGIDDEERTHVIIHTGNFPKDTKGCILVGEDVKDIDGDDIPEITDSRNAMSELRGYLKSKSFDLYIVETYDD